MSPSRRLVTSPVLSSTAFPARSVRAYVNCADDRASQSRGVAVDPGEQWSRLVDPDGVGPELLFHRVPEGKIVKNRMHLDVRLAPGAPPAERRRLVDAEATRLRGLGAVHVRTDEDETDY